MISNEMTIEKYERSERILFYIEEDSEACLHKNI